ncbi:hypothetical protein GBA52_020438 [Prunus armeniaca]|nr:hypothetical protein GBA52_020438 [Prunus armeniaca]
MGFSEKLVRVDVSSNLLNPSTLANCTSFLRFRIQNSQINGSILTSFAFLPNLTYVDLINNNFTSTITEDFGNVEKLEYFPEPTSHKE